MTRKFTREEMNERLFKAIQEMSNQEIERLYNQEFGNKLKYVDDDIFEQGEWK
jgi:hypothetical protein